MRFVDDDQVPGGALQFLEDLLLLREVGGGQVVGNMVERVGTEDEAAVQLLQLTGVANGLEAQTEAGAHLAVPLSQEGAGRLDDENAVGAAPGDQLSDHQPGLDRLAQAHAVGQEEPGPDSSPGRA